MRTLTLTLLVALSGLISCGSPQVQRQETAAAACLPVYLPQILACHTPTPGDASAEAVCIAVRVAELTACWSHAVPPAPPTPPTVTSLRRGTPRLRLAGLPGTGLHLYSVDIGNSDNGHQTVYIDADVAESGDVPQALTDALAEAWRELVSGSGGGGM